MRKFARTTIFYEIHNVCHLQSNLEKYKKKLWKKDSECKYCKDISKIEIQCFLCFFSAFPFQPLIKGYCSSYSWFVTCYCLKMAPKIPNTSNFTKELHCKCLQGFTGKVHFVLVNMIGKHYTEGNHNKITGKIFNCYG